MIPRRVSPPAGAIVALADLKAHLRVEFEDDDAHISSLEAAAVAWLDGWHGVLGRCLSPQIWEVDMPKGGPHRLPLPDVAEVATGAGYIQLAHDRQGSTVTLSEAATVTFSMSPPPNVVIVAGQIIKMMVAHWYENRASVVTGTIATEMPLGVEIMLRPIKWTRI